MLRIQPLRAPRDENVYECVARNSEGQVFVTAKLAIIRGKTAARTPSTPERGFNLQDARLNSVAAPAPCHTLPLTEGCSRLFFL